MRQRIARLRGVLTFTLRTEYHERLTCSHEHLHELECRHRGADEQYQEFVRTRQAAVHSFEGYDTPIGRLRTRVAEALGKVNLLMARQGRVLEPVAIDELDARRERLEAYQTQARYALADSYDRATRGAGQSDRDDTLRSAGGGHVMRRHRACSSLGAAFLACVLPARRRTDTLAQLRAVEPDVAGRRSTDGLDLAMQSYRRYLDETPNERDARSDAPARGPADREGVRHHRRRASWIEMAAPEAGESPSRESLPRRRRRLPAIGVGERVRAGLRAARQRSSSASRLRRTCCSGRCPRHRATTSRARARSKPSQLYERLLAEYPNYERNDQVLYQMARAYDELGRTEEAMEVMQRLIGEFGTRAISDEVQFRRGEYFFTRRKFREAEGSYEAIIGMGPASEFYELALYKLGWSLYKQDFYDEALHRYIALLDYKLSVGYDFDAQHEEDDERRIADTFRVISLSFSNLGGPEVVAASTSRPTAIAATRTAFIATSASSTSTSCATTTRPKSTTRSSSTIRSTARSPHFSMRVIGIYETGGFPKLVLESKKSFASELRPAVPSTGSTSTSANRPRCSAT